MNEKIKWFIIGAFAALFGCWICSRCALGGTDGNKEFDSAINSTKQQLTDNYNAAKAGNSKIANYNQQLESGQRDLGEYLRGADKHLDEAIRIRTQEIERKQGQGGGN